MKKQGFTLTELIGVITILSIIALIMIPSVTSRVKEAKETSYQTQIETIKKAANDYILTNMNKGVNFSKFLKNDGDTTDIYLIDLKREGLIDKNIKNPKTGSSLSDDMIIKITRNKGNYEILVGTYIDTVFKEGLFDDENNSNTDIDSTLPVIMLKGSAVRYYEVDASCSSDCDILENDIKNFVTVKGASQDNLMVSTTSISKKEINKYNISYNVTSENGKSAKTITVIVSVRDTTKPIIDVPASTTINSSDEDYDLLEGVTFTDNSVNGYITCNIDGSCNNNFKLKISGSLTTSTPGNYTITYNLTDASGNTRTKTRNFVVEEPEDNDE